jgi:Transglutaminase-like superfamily
VASQVRLGVVKDNGALKAHAWLVGDGDVVAECGSDESEYVPFDRAVLASSETKSR